MPKACSQNRLRLLIRVFTCRPILAGLASLIRATSDIGLHASVVRVCFFCRRRRRNASGEACALHLLVCFSTALSLLVLDKEQPAYPFGPDPLRAFPDLVQVLSNPTHGFEGSLWLTRRLLHTDCAHSSSRNPRET